MEKAASERKSHKEVKENILRATDIRILGTYAAESSKRSLTFAQRGRRPGTAHDTVSKEKNEVRGPASPDFGRARKLR